MTPSSSVLILVEHFNKELLRVLGEEVEKSI